ncbi:RHS repeat domain-containing protein [Marinicella sp. W31]|uniref:RHS repeat domain-containing protein n=1 Tax=Marinicella sp. W31 TaxID=3023713 RepID=UPI003756F760
MLHYDDNYNRVKQITYQGGFSVHNQYTQYGELQKQKVAHDATNNYLMRINDWNLQGQMTQREMNNGLLDVDYTYYPSTAQIARIRNKADNSTYEQTLTYKYDPWGNIVHQKQNLDGLNSHEYLDYDRLHRLITTERKHTGTPPANGSNLPKRNTYNYDNLGNMLSKSDFNRTALTNSYGTVEPISNVLCDTSGTSVNPGPNAITRAPTDNSQSLNYYYDHKGNRRIDCYNFGTSIKEFRAGYRYDADNLMIKAESAIRTNGGNLITFQNVDYRYGSDNQRYRKYDAYHAEITLYGNKDYERIYNLRTGEVQQKYYVTDYLTLTRYNNKPSTWHYMQKDRLGSTTLVTDTLGEVVHARGYDPFGKPRNADWSDQDVFNSQLFTARLGLIDPENPASANISKRGFTDHEHLDYLQLIHMNGRMYDFNNGRFLSVDPYIAGAGSQSINPYTYIFNNPLSGTDPSGYKACDATSEDGACKPQPKLRDPAPGQGEEKEKRKGQTFTNMGKNGIQPLSSKIETTPTLSTIGNQETEVNERSLAQNKREDYCLEMSNCGAEDTFTYGGNIDEATRPFEIASEYLDDPLVYIGGGVFKATGTGLLYIVKGQKLVPFAKIFGLSKDAKFAQTTFRNEFSKDGIKEIENITGVKGIRSVDQLSEAIVSGKVNPADIHVNIIVRDGNTLILNTRSAHALEQAGIPRSSYTVIDRTGDTGFEEMLSDQLKRNNLGNEGVSTVIKEY